MEKHRPRRTPIVRFVTGPVGLVLLLMAILIMPLMPLGSVAAAPASAEAPPAKAAAKLPNPIVSKDFRPDANLGVARAPATAENEPDSRQSDHRTSSSVADPDSRKGRIRPNDLVLASSTLGSNDPVVLVTSDPHRDRVFRARWKSRLRDDPAPSCATWSLLGGTSRFVR